MVVVTAIGTSGPAVISGHVSPSLHRFLREALQVGIPESGPRVLLAGVGVAVGPDGRAAAWHDRTSAANTVIVDMMRMMRNVARW
jgi:hypothetical protein